MKEIRLHDPFLEGVASIYGHEWKATLQNEVIFSVTAHTNGLLDEFLIRMGGSLAVLKIKE